MFKNAGKIQYDRTLLIPSTERIPALTKSEDGYKQILAVLSIALQKTFAVFNLKRGMNDDQIIDLAEQIIEESRADNLSIEDVLLFLDQLKTGKYGKLYDRLDMPLFFELMEHYREERHLAMLYLRYEAESNYKALGDPTRTSDGKMENDENTRQVMSAYYRKNAANEKENPLQSPPEA